MRDHRRFSVNCFFYDRSGIQNRLEDLAQKGWMLDSIDYFGWRFKRIEPKKLHYAATYFAASNEYTPDTDESLAAFNELCAHSGWSFIDSASNLRIYCSEQESPVPIDTDPLVELDTIHRAAGKSFLRHHHIYIGFSAVMMALTLWLFISDPISSLSDNTHILSFFIFPAALIMSLVELIGYYRWRKKALTVAEETGEFLPGRSHPVFGRIMTGLLIVLFIAYFALDGLDRDSFELCLRVIIMLVIGFAAYRAREYYKELGYSGKANAGATFGVILVLALILTVFSEVITSQSVFEKIFPENGDGEQSDITYEFKGSTYHLYRHSLPLYMEDIYGVDGENYSNWKMAYSSVFMNYLQAHIDRKAGVGDVGPIGLQYTYIETKLPFVYELIEKEYFETFTKANYYANRNTELIPSEPSPWNADEAWQLYYNGTASGDYIVRWDNDMLCIFPETDLTEDEMLIIANTLRQP